MLPGGDRAVTNGFVANFADSLRQNPQAAVMMFQHSRFSQIIFFLHKTLALAAQ